MRVRAKGSATPTHCKAAESFGQLTPEKLGIYWRAPIPPLLLLLRDQRRRRHHHAVLAQHLVLRFGSTSTGWQSHRTVTLFWQPLTVASLNQPMAAQLGYKEQTLRRWMLPFVPVTARKLSLGNWALPVSQP